MLNALKKHPRNDDIGATKSQTYSVIILPYPAEEKQYKKDPDMIKKRLMMKLNRMI